jgi:hypothetical protein
MSAVLLRIRKTPQGAEVYDWSGRKMLGNELTLLARVYSVEKGERACASAKNDFHYGEKDENTFEMRGLL